MAEDQSVDSIRNRYPPILTTAQVAELLGLNVRTVMVMANDGRLPASRLPGSRKYHFLLDDVLTTLARHRIQTPPAKSPGKPSPGTATAQKAASGKSAGTKKTAAPKTAKRPPAG